MGTFASPTILCLQSPASNSNTLYIHIFAQCFQAFDPSNLFVLVFVGLAVKVYDNSLLLIQFGSILIAQFNIKYNIKQCPEEAEMRCTSMNWL